MISFAGSDFFFNNSGFLFHSLFFLQNRFLFPRQISYRKTPPLLPMTFSFFPSDFFSQVRFPFANWRLSFTVWFLFSIQISFPRSDSFLQIGGSFLQYDFFSPVRFLTVKLPLRIPWPFLFPDQVSFPQSVAVLPSGQSSPLRLTCCRKRHRQADRRRHISITFSRQTKSHSHFLHKWGKAEAASFHW